MKGGSTGGKLARQASLQGGHENGMDMDALSCRKCVTRRDHGPAMMERGMRQANYSQSKNYATILVVSPVAVAIAQVIGALLNNLAHPVEHLPDGVSNPGAMRWMSARTDMIEQIVVEFDYPDHFEARVRGQRSNTRTNAVGAPRRLRGWKPNIPPASGSGVHL
jgi:hypothetical protein